jgi:hypothetical protein
MQITNPYLVAYPLENGNLETRLLPPEGFTHLHYAVLICGLVRHVSQYFSVPEAAVWEIIENERRNPTAGAVPPA